VDKNHLFCSLFQGCLGQDHGKDGLVSEQTAGVAVDVIIIIVSHHLHFKEK